MLQSVFHYLWANCQHNTLEITSEKCFSQPCKLKRENTAIADQQPRSSELETKIQFVTTKPRDSLSQIRSNKRTHCIYEYVRPNWLCPHFPSRLINSERSRHLAFYVTGTQRKVPYVHSHAINTAATGPIKQRVFHFIAELTPLAATVEDYKASSKKLAI